MTQPKPAAPGPQQIFHPRRIRLHQSRARKIGGENFLWQEAAQGMADRLAPVTRRFAKGLWIGPQSPALAPFAASWTETGFDDAERLDIAGQPPRANLALSLLRLHQINDLPGVLRQIRQSLQPGSLFLGALFGGATLHELREALEAGEMATGRQPAQRVAPFADVQALGNLLGRAGFTQPVAESEHTEVHYRDLTTLFTDLRRMGESGNLAAQTPLSRAALAAAMAHYAEHNRTPDGKYIASFDILYLTGWVPDKTEKIVIPR